MADTRRPGPSRPPVRLRPAPRLDPPFTDEQAISWPRPIGGQLTLDLPGPGRPDRPVGRHRPAAIGTGRPASPAPPAAALATATPEATRVAHRFLSTCLEIVNGFRPVAQIRPLCHPSQSSIGVEQLARAVARIGPVRRRSPRPASRLLRLRVCEPASGVLEAAAVLSGASGTSWAMAFRLERRQGNWSCFAIQVL